MRLDSRRPEDRQIGRHCDYWQNGEAVNADVLRTADEDLGVVESFLTVAVEPGDKGGFRFRWDLDANREPITRRTEGPVEIRLKDGAPPEIARLYRERRLQEQR